MQKFEKLSIINFSAGDCSISLKFRTYFEHMTLDIPRTFKFNASKVKRSRSQRLPTYQRQKRHNSVTDKLSKVKLGLLDCVQIWYRVSHVTGDTLQMFKVKGQRSKSQSKVIYQQQKRYNTAMDRFGIVIKASKAWHGSVGLKLQCIRNYHVFSVCEF